MWCDWFIEEIARGFRKHLIISIMVRRYRRIRSGQHSPVHSKTKRWEVCKGGRRWEVRIADSSHPRKQFIRCTPMHGRLTP